MDPSLDCLLAEVAGKVRICEFLGLVPLFPLRCPSDEHFAVMQRIGGLALKFKSRVFPPGTRELVANIWNHFRLPVTIWESFPPNLERQLLNFHATRLANNQGVLDRGARHHT